MTDKAKWTILTYIAAHNNLQELGQQSLQQIINVGSTRDVMHGVLFDGADGGRRYIIGDAGLVLEQEPLKNFDSGDPDRLIETARFVFEKYRAEHYGLVLWSHGSGWRPEEIEEVAQQVRGDRDVDQTESHDRAATAGSYALFRSTLKTIVSQPTRAERAILFDDGTGHSLDTLELEGVTQKIQDVLGQPLDLLGMDACLMASVEVAYQIKDTTRYLVASEELVPGHSWPYDLIYGALRAQPDYSPHDLATRVVQDYVAYYSQHPPSAGDVTKVALDLSKINTLSTAVTRVAQALTVDMVTQADVVWSAQHAAMKQETRNDKRRDNKFQFSLWDLGSLSSRLATSDQATPAVKQAASEVMNALHPGSAVVAEGHYGSWFDGIGGASVYLVPPSASRRISPYYKELAFARDTHWDKMLQSYFETLT